MTDQEKLEPIRKLRGLRVDAVEILGQHIDGILSEFVGPIAPSAGESDNKN